jgi:hypothetical protein
MTIDNPSTATEGISTEAEAQTTETSSAPETSSTPTDQPNLEGAIQIPDDDVDLRGENAYQDQQAEQLYADLETGTIAHEAVVDHDIF